MAYIIGIRKLYEVYRGNHFGYVGIELKTGKFRYFTIYDEEGFYDYNQLNEFDICNPQNDVLRWHLNRCEYKRELYSEKLPTDIKPLIDILIEKHKSFNIQNSFPIDTLESNRKNLSIQYTSNFSLFSENNFSGVYQPVENVIGLTVTDREWQKMDSDQKKSVVNTLLHEIGHMKTSKIVKFDKVNNEIYVRTGFVNLITKVNPIALKNGDVFLEVINQRAKYKEQEELILEEIMNDFECKLIDSEYRIVYPNFGKELNNLCEGRLIKAKYTNGIEEYYESLIRIINDKDLADELLYSLVELANSYEWNYEKNTKKTLKLIKDYEEAKRKKF